MSYNDVRMAQWIRRLPTEQEILGSSPSTDYLFYFDGVTGYLALSLVAKQLTALMHKSHLRTLLHPKQESNHETFCPVTWLHLTEDTI
jgi:hypothetical protein